MKKILYFPALAALCLTVACENPQGEKQIPQAEESPAEEADIPVIKTDEHTYRTEETEMAGYFAYDASTDAKRPGILVVHEWWGQNDYVRTRAEQLAGLGYVALAVDMYGDGQTAEHPDDAMKFSSMVMENIESSQTRFEAAFKALSEHPKVNPDQISAVGYCFGGSVALSMANAGMPLDGVAAFHSGINLPIPPGEKLTAKLLVQNGADDPMISEDDAEAFKAAVEMAGGYLDYRSFPGVLHAYTNPGADKLGQKFDLPLKYDEEADRASWERMKLFFAELYRAGE